MSSGVVRGTDAINLLLKLTEVEGLLVLLDDPDDLVPPPSPTDAAPPTPEAASFDITLTRTPGRATLTLVGELDIATTPRLNKHLSTLKQTHHGLVVIDLRQLTFLDATGVTALVAADSYARRDGWTLTIVTGPPQVQRVLESCGLTEVLPLADEPLGYKNDCGYTPASDDTGRAAALSMRGNGGRRRRRHGRRLNDSGAFETVVTAPPLDGLALGLRSRRPHQTRPCVTVARSRRSGPRPGQRGPSRLGTRPHGDRRRP